MNWLAIWRDRSRYSLRFSKNSGARSARHASLVLAVALVAGACGRPSISLTYRFKAGDSFTYQWTIDSTTEVDSALNPDTQILRLVIEAREEISSVSADGIASVRWTLQTIERIEDGVATAPSSQPLMIELDVRKDGSVAGTRVPTQPSPEFDAGSLVSEAHLRLPSEPVSIGDSWSVPVQIQTEQTSLALEGTGKLLGFDLERRRRLARIEVRKSGTVSSRQTVERVQLTISGTITISGNASIDADSGQLVSAESRSTSRLKVGPRAQEPGETRKITVLTRIELI